MEKQIAEIKQLELEIDINATPERVWAALTEDISQWWPAEFYAGGEDGKRSYVLEAHPGGRMFEQWDAGGGVLWGNVVLVEPNVCLKVLGNVFPNWGGPTEWYGTWELTAQDNGTRLKYSESDVGRIADSGVGEKIKGWTFLWDTMKAFVEGNPPPSWQD